MRIFNFECKSGNKYSIVCDWAKTRTAFKHTACVLNTYGNELGKTKICYLNRTWECYQFQSVAQKATEKFIPKEDRQEILDQLSGYNLA